jgi:hypothetical protein
MKKSLPQSSGYPRIASNICIFLIAYYSLGSMTNNVSSILEADDTTRGPHVENTSNGAAMPSILALMVQSSIVTPL